VRSGPRDQCRKRGNNSSVHVGVCVDAIWFIERGESHLYKKSSSLASALRDWSCGIGLLKDIYWAEIRVVSRSLYL